MERTHKSRFGKILLISVVILGFLAAGGYAAWHYLDLDNQSNTTDAPETTQEIDTEPEDTVEIEEYESNEPAIAFSYPSNWTVRENDDTLLVESPEIEFKDSNEQLQTGYFRIFLRQTSRDEDANYIGRGVATLPSEPLIYEEPSVNQREETSLSFFGYDNQNNLAFMLVAGNFTLEPGDILGSNYGREEGSYIIGGGYSSDELSDDLQMYQLNPADFQATNEYEQALEILQSIQIR